MTYEQFLDRLRMQRGQFFVDFKSGEIRHVSKKDRHGYPCCPIIAQPECSGMSNGEAEGSCRNKLGFLGVEVISGADSRTAKGRKDLLSALALKDE